MIQSIAESCSGLIVGVSGVDASGKGPASGITYSVQITRPTGPVITIPNGLPNQERPSDLVNTVAAKVGQTCFCSRIANTWYFNVWEWPDIKNCSAGGANA